MHGSSKSFSEVRSPAFPRILIRENWRALAIISILAILGIAYFARPWTYWTSAQSFAQPKTFRELLTLTPTQINQCDVGLISLLCAEGLVGSENMDVKRCLNTLDQAASAIAKATEIAMTRYQVEPYFYKNYSVNQFKIMVMASYVQRSLHWIYNPDLAWLPSKKTERSLLQKMGQSSKHVFIWGLLDEPHMGTCSSIPSLWVAFGARLGYPLYTVQANTHNFTRWDDGKEKFNFEVVDGGVSFPTDHTYLQWPFPLTQEHLATDHYLKNQTPADNCAYFLACRLGFLWRAGDREGVAECALKIRELVPNDREFMKTVWAAQRALTPPTPRELHSPQTDNERLTQQLLSLTQPGSDVLQNRTIRVYDENADQLQALRNSGMDERTVAIIAQSLPHSEPASQIPSLDPMDIALKDMNPQVREIAKLAIQGKFSLAGASTQNYPPAFSEYPITQYPINQTWGRYEQ